MTNIPYPETDNLDPRVERMIEVSPKINIIQAIGFYLMQTRLIETFEISQENPPVDLSQRPDPNNEGLKAWREGRG